jgi:hypothetical protein
MFAPTLRASRKKPPPLGGGFACCFVLLSGRANPRLSEAKKEKVEEY